MTERIEMKEIGIEKNGKGILLRGYKKGLLGKKEKYILIANMENSEYNLLSNLIEGENDITNKFINTVYEVVEEGPQEFYIKNEPPYDLLPYEYYPLGTLKMKDFEIKSVNSASGTLCTLIGNGEIYADKKFCMDEKRFKKYFGEERGKEILEVIKNTDFKDIEQLPDVGKLNEELYLERDYERAEPNNFIINNIIQYDLHTFLPSIFHEIEITAIYKQESGGYFGIPMLKLSIVKDKITAILGRNVEYPNDFFSVITKILEEKEATIDSIYLSPSLEEAEKFKSKIKLRKDNKTIYIECPIHLTPAFSIHYSLPLHVEKTKERDVAYQ